MRPYTQAELEELRIIEKHAELTAIQLYGRPGDSAGKRAADWTKAFHTELESCGVAAGLKQPRSFFERKGK